MRDSLNNPDKFDYRPFKVFSQLYTLYKGEFIQTIQSEFNPFIYIALTLNTPHSKFNIIQTFYWFYFKFEHFEQFEYYLRE